jgi:hypothetical protein
MTSVLVVVAETIMLTRGDSGHDQEYVMGLDAVPSAVNSATSHAAMLLGPFMVILSCIFMCFLPCIRIAKTICGLASGGVSLCIYLCIYVPTTLIKGSCPHRVARKGKRFHTQKTL